jgi:hypothetical protein
MEITGLRSGQRERASMKKLRAGEKNNCRKAIRTLFRLRRE